MKKFYFLFFLITAIPVITCAQSDYKDVAPIFYSRCASCHHIGGAGPFPMMNYSQTNAWTSFIQIVLTTGQMPPWPPDTTYTRFQHERTITQSEKAAILNWISTGATKGDTTLAPSAPTFVKQKLNGIPDLILQIPTFTSTASTGDIYVCFALPTGLTQDRIMRAFEITPGNNAIVHHVVVTADSTGNAATDLSGSCYTQPGDLGIGGYAPNSPPSVFPSSGSLKSGMRIKAGSKVVLQIHYPKGTAGMKDSTKIAMYFYPINTSGIRPMYSTTALQNWTMYIPANTSVPFTAKYPASGGLPIPISIFASDPHCHKICKEIVNYAYSGIDTIPLIRINNWNFEWQGFYNYHNLVKVPAGYKLFASHVYDNTTNNPNNPAPKLVLAGPNTNNEMLFDAFQWMYYQPGDENIDLDSLLANDPLLSVKEPVTKTKFSSFAYPNPFNEKINISYYLNTAEAISVSIYSIYGAKVKTYASRNEVSGAHDVEWNGKNDAGVDLPMGVCFYNIIAGKESTGGKIILTQKK